jgi:hypothetical protein
MVLSRFSRWSAPLNTAIPPGFMGESAHIYGDSVRNCSGLGAPGIVPRVISASTEYRVFGDQFEHRPKNQPYSSSNNRKSLSPDGCRFHFLCEHRVSSFWSKTALESRKIKLLRTIFLHYTQIVETDIDILLLPFMLGLMY